MRENKRMKECKENEEVTSLICYNREEGSRSRRGWGEWQRGGQRRRQPATEGFERIRIYYESEGRVLKRAVS